MALNTFTVLIPVVFLIFCCCVSAFSSYESVKFNETCTHSDNCVDYKMLCTRTENNEMRCLCSEMLYIWSDHLKECIMDSDKLKRWLFRVQAETNDLGEVSKTEFSGAFLAMALCGFVVILALLIFLGFLCVLIGCQTKMFSKYLEKV